MFRIIGSLQPNKRNVPSRVGALVPFSGFR